MFKKDPNFAEDAICYSAWREYEAYQIPVTEEGTAKAAERWKAYKAGWIEALKGKSIEGWHQEWVPDTENPWKEESKDV